MIAGDSGPTAARARLLDWLADIGPRWGVPEEACRVHGWLYLRGIASAPAEIGSATGIAGPGLRSALAWLAEHRLVEESGDGRWTTGSDPWDLVVRALEVRRQRELGPALEVLRSSRREAAGDSILAGRIGKLLTLVEDISAIDAQAQRLSPAALRRLVGAGARAARFVDIMTRSSKRGRR